MKQRSTFFRRARTSGIILLAVSGGLLVALAPPRNDLDAVFARLNAEVLRNGRAYETLADASLTIGHRLTGSANGRRAEEYTFNLLAKYGYTDLRYQPFEVEAWSRDTATLAIAPGKSDNFRDVPTVALAHSPVSAKVGGYLVDVGDGLEEDFEAKKEAIKGRVVLANIGLLKEPRMRRNLHRSEKTALAIRYGAAGIVMVNTVAGEVLLTGTASVTGSLIPIPAVSISLESGRHIRDWMQTEKLMAFVEMTNANRPVRARNVIATLKGKTKEKIVIGGHLDSWDLATGAIDNGIGSFAVLDIARAFKALNLKPHRTIEFVQFMGEEQGLLGSKAYVREAVKAGTLDQIRCMINLDMTNNPKGFNASGRSELVPLLTQIGERIKALDPGFASVIGNQAGLHSDHQPFMIEGVPTLTPTGGLAPHVLGCYHANCDRFDLVDRTGLQNTVRFTAMLLYALADAPALPSKRLPSDQTRDFLVRQGLKDQLILGREWKWGE
jgi:Zn-dependent M28 family amino/carboxypeptidase